MENEQKEVLVDRRTIILQSLYSTLSEKASAASQNMLETLKSKAQVDGPMQSKQPDEMIKLEGTAAIFEQQASSFNQRAEEVLSLLENRYESDGRVKVGAILIWNIKIGDSKKKEETVIITHTGGGEIGNFRLLANETLLSKALIDRQVGEKLEVGDMTIWIKEVF